MRSRKAAARPVEEESADEMVDAFPSEDGAVEGAPAIESPAAGERVCLGCGGRGTGEGCDHREIARFDAPSRAVQEAVARLRRAAAEHRAAARALRALAMADVSRGRAEFDAVPFDPAALPCERCAERDAAPPRACERCAERDAAPPPACERCLERDAAPPPPCDRCAEREGDLVIAGPNAARSARRKGRAPAGQQAFPFLATAPPELP